MPDVDQLLEAIGEGDQPAIERLLSDTPELMHRRGGWMGQTPLHAAAACGRVEIAEWLLDRGADVNARDEGDNATPLHWAAENAHLEVAQLLLDRGADLHANDDYHNAGPLGWATTISKVRPAIAQLLIDRGATVSIFHAIALGDEDRIETAVSPGVLETRLEQFAHFDHPLHYAASLGRIDALKLLVDKGADANRQNWLGLTPLAVATICGHDAAAAVLAEMSDPNHASVRLAQGRTITEADRQAGRFDDTLHLAAQRGLVEMATVLLESGSDPNRVIEWWKDLRVAPIHPAASYGHLELVQLLVERGADGSITDSKYGGTALGWAQQYDREDVAEYLAGRFA